MSIFSRKQRSNLLKKFIAPAVISSSLFSSTNAMKYPWEIKDSSIRCIFDDTFNILWIDGVNNNKNLVDNINGKIAKSINDKVQELKKNNEGIEIRFMKNGINNIENFNFMHIKNLRKISFPERFREITYDTFDDCLELEEIDFPKELISLSSGMRNCKKLKHIILPQCSEYLYFNFCNCENLEIVEFPEQVVKPITNWGYTFKNCYNLREIKNFPKLVKRSDGRAYCLYSTFENCKSLNKIEIKSDEKLELCKTFAGCESLFTISVENVDKAEDIIDNCYSLMVLELKKM